MHASSKSTARTALVRVLVASSLAAALYGCSFVELTEAGRGVQLVTPEQAADCKKIGAVNSKVLARFVGFDRSATKVARELADLAKNEAAENGGNTIVPTSPIEGGRQSFDLYRCDD